MTFLNSALIWGLLAATLPLLLHLFSRRRFPRIDFSTLRFLKRLQRQQMRKLQLKQWLLLLLRTLAIILIVLAFARPAFLHQTNLGSISSSRIGMAIVLDASASMQSKSQNGTSFEEARSAIDTLLCQMNPGDRAFLVLAKSRPEALWESPSGDPAALRRALERARVWDGPADLAAALTCAAEALRSPSSGQDFRNEIYLFSDFAATPVLPEPPPNMIPFFVRIEPESAENLSVSSVKVSSEMIEPGQPVDLEVTLANHGRRNRESVYYSAFLHDTRVAEDVVAIGAQSKITRRLQVLPEGSGLQAGMIEIEDQDVLSADNRAYFCFSVPERVDVLLVGDPETSKAIRLALAPAPQSQSLISLVQTDRSSWEAASLMHFGAIIFSDPPSITPAQSSKLQKYVENGGGLLIFPGSRTDVAALNREFLEPLGMPLWGDKLAQMSAGGAFLSWRALDLENPLFRGMLRPGAQPASPHFFQALRLVGSGAETLISFPTGAPLLTQSILGKGRAIIAASSPEPSWSDWASRGIFAPLMHRLVLRLAGAGTERCQSLLAGMDLQFPAAADGASIANLMTPENEEIKLPPQTQGKTIQYRLTSVNPAGNYFLKAGTTAYLASVNIPLTESDLEANDLLKSYPEWRKAGVILTRPAELMQTVQSSRYGRELWKSALLAGLVVLLAESAMGSTFKVQAEKTASEEV